jgi:glycogen phosphorylase
MNEVRDVVPRPNMAPAAADLLDQYGCGPVQLSGHSDALYERHLLFDDVIDPTFADARTRFEAVARSVRDVLSQRWVRTSRTHHLENPKRIYYLSMEFLIGRSFTNNVTNLLLDPFVQETVWIGTWTGWDWLSRNPMPVSETAD